MHALARMLLPACQSPSGLRGERLPVVLVPLQEEEGRERREFLHVSQGMCGFLTPPIYFDRDIHFRPETVKIVVAHSLCNALKTDA